MAEVNSMVRTGIVSVLDTKTHKVRCYFPDMSELMSGWLYVLQRPGETLSTSTVEGHSHSGSVKTFMPKVNDRVLVLYPSGWNTDGYVLGVIP